MTDVWLVATILIWLMLKWAFLTVYYALYGMYWLTGLGLIPFAIRRSRGRHHLSM